MENYIYNKLKPFAAAATTSSSKSVKSEEKNKENRFELLWFVLAFTRGLVYKSMESIGGNGSCDKTGP